MRGRKNAFILLTCLAFWLILVVTAENNQDDDGMGGEVSLARLSTFISLATSYLVRVCHTADQDPEFPGKFTYIAYLHQDLEFDFAANPQETYNLLRHNGAIYSLALLYARQQDEQVLGAMTRLIDFLKTFAIDPVPDVSDNDKVGEEWPDMPNVLAAWENKSVSPDISHDTAKLGGAGLALIALASLEQIAPGTTDLDYMRQLGEFIAFLQHDDGSFTSKYIPDKGGRDTKFVSLFYPGEASLGMVYLERFIGIGEDHVENLKERMYRDISIGIKFFAYSQETVETLNMHGGVPLKYPPNGDSNKEVRVDYVQHSMSAVIAYERLLRSKSRSAFLSKSGSKFHLRHLNTSSFEFGPGFWRLVLLVVLFVVATVAISLWRKPKKKTSKEQ
jgi:hypothetical protein